jgi:hypothetical protein
LQIQPKSTLYRTAVIDQNGAMGQDAVKQKSPISPTLKT